METRKLRGMLRRARGKLPKTKAGQIIRRGPKRGAIHSWETKGSLTQLRYALALARRSPSLALRFLFEMDPAADYAWLRMPRRYVALENVRDVLRMKGVELCPPRAVEGAVSDADNEALEHAANEPKVRRQRSKVREDAEAVIEMASRRRVAPHALKEAKRIRAEIISDDRELELDIEMQREAAQAAVELEDMLSSQKANLEKLETIDSMLKLFQRMKEDLLKKVENR